MTEKGRRVAGGGRRIGDQNGRGAGALSLVLFFFFPCAVGNKRNWLTGGASGKISHHQAMYESYGSKNIRLDPDLKMVSTHSNEIFRYLDFFDNRYKYEYFIRISNSNIICLISVGYQISKHFLG
jgi:hypothetical protein